VIDRMGQRNLAQRLAGLACANRALRAVCHASLAASHSTQASGVILL
jgi:hypothetical protein